MPHLPRALLLAWVLWSLTAPRSDPSKVVYAPVDSMTREADCRAKAQTMEAAERLNLAEDIRFRCFPDTVDPRPKS